MLSQNEFHATFRQPPVREVCQEEKTVLAFKYMFYNVYLCSTATRSQAILAKIRAGRVKRFLSTVMQFCACVTMA